MAALSSRQWIAISVSLIIFGSLFFINRKPPVSGDKQPVAGGHVNTAEDFARILEDAKKQVPEEWQGSIDKLNNSLANATGDERIQILKDIITRYDSAKAVIPGTYYMEKLAALRNSADLWYKAADRYFDASEVANEQSRVVLIQKASECYNNSNKIDSNNLDTKVGIGKCLVESSPAPMQGIAIIEGVIKKDSNNFNAQLVLGELSIQSGQIDKALYRFHRVLQINPSYSDAYLYLAEAYEKSGNKPQAVENLEKYSTFVTDKKTKEEINSEIRRLNTDTVTNK
ncbi:MAG: tetratricopeptide repeat protein [Bacteroidia bacterium]